jgi:RIO-like serine/threonine protein kinase
VSKLLFKATATPSLRRCVLVHDDMNERNILVDKDGHITGVGNSSLLSLRLIIDYPPWLSYDGSSDPPFSNARETFWLEP